jgi:hypothetical protein
MNPLAAKFRRSNALTFRILIGAATLGAALVLIRALPDLIRYMRVRRM